MIIFLAGPGLSVIVAQKPAWIEYEGRATFPEKEYITGFAKDKKTRKESYEAFENKLVNQARSKLLEKISLSVRSTTIYKVSQKNGKRDESYNQEINVSYDSQDASFPVIYYFDKKTRTGYAIAYLNKKKTLERIENLLKQFNKDLETTLTEADRMMKKGQLGLSFQQYLSAKKIVSEMKKLNTEFRYFNNGLSVQNGQYDLLEKTNLINRKINYLKKQPAISIEQLINLVYINLEGLKLDTDMPVSIDYVLTKKSHIKTEFSNILKEMMLANLKKLMSNDVIGFNVRFKHYRLSGKYWLTEDNLNILFKLEVSENYQQIPVQYFETRISRTYLDERRIKYKSNDVEKNNQAHSDSLVIRMDNKLYNISGLYIDKTGKPYQYIRIKDFEPISENEVFLNAIYMKAGLMQDIRIKLNIKRKEVSIPHLGYGRVGLNSKSVYFYSYPGSAKKFKFIKANEYEN